MIDLDANQSLADIPRFGARHYPERIAQNFHGITTTYGAFDERASRVANQLVTAGCAPGMRAAILSKNSNFYFEVIFGAAKARTVTVCVNWRLAAPEIAFVLNDSESRILFVGRDYYPIIEKIRSELRLTHTIIALDGGHSEWPAYEDWRAAGSPFDPMLTARAEDAAIQMYTSGTTGQPKGVELCNRNFLALFRMMNSMTWSQVDGRARLLIVVPLFHLAGIDIALMGFAQGAQNVIQREFDAGRFAELVQEHGITHAMMVPAVILFVLQLPAMKTADFSSLRYIVYGSAPIAEDLLREARAVFGCGFAQVYGLTESTGIATCLTPEDHANHPEKLKSCGRTSLGIDIRLVTPQGREAKPGEVGEVLIRGDCVMKGYWKRPEANAEAIVDGWLHSGDAAYRDEEGYLYIHDRIKEMIISGGENVYPAEVESALFAHPKIADVAVIGVPDKIWGEAVKAVVVPKPGENPTPEEIIAFVRERIAPYKCPKSVDFTEELPRNASGKILRRELRKPYWQGQTRAVH